MRAVTLYVCASLVVSVVTAQDGVLENLLTSMEERIKKTEENVASLMSKLQSIIEEQASELDKIAALEDLTRKQKSTIDELSKENDDQAKRLGQYEAEIKKDEEADNALGNKVSSLEKQYAADLKELKDQMATFKEKETEMMGPQKIESGQVVFSEVGRRWGNLHTVSHGKDCSASTCTYRQDIKRVMFTTSFKHPPVVFAAVTQMFITHDVFNFEVKDVTTDGFTLFANTPSGWFLRKLTVSWMALPQASGGSS